MDTRFGTSNARSLHRAGSLVSASKELSKYKFNLLGVWEVGGTKPEGEYISVYRKRNENPELGTVFLYAQGNQVSN
jgi:hypothetical protein